MSTSFSFNKLDDIILKSIFNSFLVLIILEQCLACLHAKHFIITFKYCNTDFKH